MADAGAAGEPMVKPRPGARERRSAGPACPAPAPRTARRSGRPSPIPAWARSCASLCVPRAPGHRSCLVLALLHALLDRRDIGLAHVLTYHLANRLHHLEPFEVSGEGNFLALVLD